MSWVVVLFALVSVFAAEVRADEIGCPDGSELRGNPPPRGQKQWCVSPDGTQDGPSVFWYPSGQKAVLATFRGDRLQGLYREWYEDGTLKEEGRRYREWSASELITAGSPPAALM